MMFLDGEAASSQLVPVRLEVGDLLGDTADVGPEPEEAAGDATEPSVMEEREPTEADQETLTEVAGTAAAGDPDEAPGVEPIVFVASASKRSTKFHRIDCTSAKKIGAKRRLEFATEAEALDHGLEPCRKCIDS